jgi:hypothetical protein
MFLTGLLSKAMYRANFSSLQQNGKMTLVMQFAVNKLNISLQFATYPHLKNSLFLFFSRRSNQYKALFNLARILHHPE